VLILLAPLDWITAGVQVHYWRLDPKNTALSSRAFTGIILSIVATLAAALGAVEIDHLEIPDDLFTIILVVAFLAVSVPQVRWLIAWYRREFH
jgi:hypothetical protein